MDATRLPTHPVTSSRVILPITIVPTRAGTAWQPVPRASSTKTMTDSLPRGAHLAAPQSCETTEVSLRNIARRLAWFLATSTACAPNEGQNLPPLDFESKHALIGIDPRVGETLCQGDRAFIDRQIEFVERQLGVRRDGLVSIFLVPLSVTEEVCGSENTACYQEDGDAVYATWQSLGHELVHAAARDFEFPSVFWSEGAAEVLSRSTLRDEGVVLGAADLDAEVLTSYRSAAHFSRFLIETHGWDDYRSTIHGGALEEVYGSSAMELVEEYEQNAPYAYPSLDPCPYPRIPQTGDSTWEAEITFSCESGDATEFEAGDWSQTPGAAVPRAVELKAGSYELLLEGGDRVFAIGCHDEVLSSATMPPSSGELYNEVDLAAALPFEAGDAHRLDLADGTYVFWVSSGTYGAATVDISITRVD